MTQILWDIPQGPACSGQSTLFSQHIVWRTEINLPTDHISRKSSAVVASLSTFWRYFLSVPFFLDSEPSSTQSDSFLYGTVSSQTYREIDIAVGQDSSNNQIASCSCVAIGDPQAYPASCPDLELKSDDLSLEVKVPAQENKVGRIKKPGITKARGGTYSVFLGKDCQDHKKEDPREKSTGHDSWGAEHRCRRGAFQMRVLICASALKPWRRNRMTPLI